MARKKICGIYKIENLINGKVYIGQSIDIERRWREHKNNYKSQDNKNYNMIIYRAMRKYDISNFKFEIIHKCEDWELDEWEIYFIQIYKSYVGVKNSNGYNMNTGGSGERKKCILSKEVRRKMNKDKKVLFLGGNSPSARKVLCDNKEFDCIKDCSIYFKVPYTNMMSWLNKTAKMPKKFKKLGLRVKEEKITILNNKNSRKIICDNIIYQNLKDFCFKNNVNFWEVKGWLFKKNLPEEWYNKKLRFENEDFLEYKVQVGKGNGNNVSNKPVICEGKRFVNIRTCADYYNQNPTTMSTWLTHKINMPKEWYEKGLHLESETMESYKIRNNNGGNNSNAKKVIAENILFDSIKDFQEYYKIKNVNGWLTKTKKIPRKWEYLNLHYATEEEILINERKGENIWQNM